MIKVSLIEDDATMISLLKTLLEFEGFEVVEMADDTLENVLAALYKENPEVALMDVNLHKLNGMDLLRALRKNQDMDRIKVIMCSGMDMREDCLSAGASDFMLKPYMPDELIAAIRKVAN
jgi:DNA-binding response OmpR family regulator